MVAVSFINPLSEDGKEIARELGNLNRIFDENSQLIEIVLRSQAQEISDDDYIPKNFAELAIKRIEWYIRKKNDRNFNYRKYAFLFNGDIIKFDVVAFYILCQAVAVRFGESSRESRIIMESQGSIIEDRLEDLSRSERKELVRRILDDLMIDGQIRWTFLADLLGSKKIQLNELILDKGDLILDKTDFMERFKDRIENRDPERMYNLLIGDRIKEFIMINVIMQKTEDYIKKVHEMSTNIQPHPNLLEIADGISKLLKEQKTYYGKFDGEIKASSLNQEAFPPCIKKILEGVSSGRRNDAIVLLLTSFLSYARLYPSIFSKNVTLKVSDVDPDIKIVQNEILPLIYEAAEKCTPPLFDDQPQEKVNINAKLGFGMHDSPDLKHEGETKWYTPMSCEKIKIHLPDLCRPDQTCKTIGNPLIYYLKKLKEVKSRNTQK